MLFIKFTFVTKENNEINEEVVLELDNKHSVPLLSWREMKFSGVL